MAIIFGIDGTGGLSGNVSGSYDGKYKKSYVRKICQSGPNRRLVYYKQGPGVLGGGLVSAVNDGVSTVLFHKKKDPKEKVLLTGFSRGAAGAVAIAQGLKRNKVSVDAMLLFDCVDRHLYVDSTTVPDNVKVVLHAVRSPKIKSRTSFGSSGMSYINPTDYTLKVFNCTHGAVGGLPAVPDKKENSNDKIKEGFLGTLNLTYAQEAQASKQVWNSCLPFMRKQGFL